MSRLGEGEVDFEVIIPEGLPTNKSEEQERRLFFAGISGILDRLYALSSPPG
jgi:hypothetical protein